MRALGYFRASSERPSIGGLSLLEQEQAFLHFCQGQGYEPLSTFVDLQPTERGGYAEYHRLLDYLRGEGRGFLVVVVRELGHLGDSPREQLKSLLEIEQLGGRVVCMDQNIADPAAAVLEGWTQKRHAQGRGEKVKEAMRLRAIRGEGLGKPAFGYRIGANRRFEVMPQEAAIVQLVYRLYLENSMGLRRIARYLNEQGITTRRGGRWSMVSIYDILRNRTYLGTYTRFGMRIPGSHPPIISNETFRQVQARLSSRPKPASYLRAVPFLLAGLVYCGYCGNRMIGVNRRQSWKRRRDGEQTQAQYRYYQCQSRTNQSVCDYHTHRAEELEAMVMAELRNLGAPQSTSHAQPHPNGKASEQASLEARIRALERRLRHHLDQAAGGAISLQQLRSLHREIDGERQGLEQRLALLTVRDREEVSLKRERQHLERALARLRNSWETLSQEDKREPLRMVIDRITVYDDHIELSLRF